MKISIKSFLDRRSQVNKMTKQEIKSNELSSYDLLWLSVIYRLNSTFVDVAPKKETIYNCFTESYRSCRNLSDEFREQELLWLQKASMQYSNILHDY